MLVHILTANVILQKKWSIKSFAQLLMYFWWEFPIPQLNEPPAFMQVHLFYKK